MTDPRNDAPRPAPASGRERLARALLRPPRTQAVVAVLLAVLGFAGVTQIRDLRSEGDYEGLRQQALIDILDGLTGTAQRAEEEIARLEAARDELKSSTNARRAALEEARSEAQALEILAGTVPVTGPGIRVTIVEEDGQVEVGSILDMVQELRTVGAEAMQVNGEVRVVAQTSFTDTPGGLLVDGVEVSPPYVVDVIGEPETLAGAMSFAQGPIAQLEADGATVRVDQLGSLEIRSVVETPES